MRQPRNPFHPGEILLEEFLAPASITQTPTVTVRERLTHRRLISIAAGPAM